MQGHLLEVSGLPWALPLRHGLMEFEYTRNYKGPRTGDSNAGNEAPSLDVSMTATADHRGHLLLGESAVPVRTSGLSLTCAMSLSTSHALPLPTIGLPLTLTLPPRPLLVALPRSCV